MPPRTLRAVQPNRDCCQEHAGSVPAACPAVVPATVPAPPSGLLRRTAAVAGREIVATAAAVCTLPLRVSCDVALSVRGRRQEPLRFPVEGEAARPVILVHGFAASPTCWFALQRALRSEGQVVATFDYWPWASSVDDLADRLVATVEELIAVTGADKVHLVGHSLGGVVIAQALTSDRLAGCVDRVVTLGSPFGGTLWARLVPVGPLVWALRPGSPFLRRLAAAPPPARVSWLVFASTTDQIVTPDRAVPVNRDVRRVLVEGAGHSGMLLAPDVIAQIGAETSRRPCDPAGRNGSPDHLRAAAFGGASPATDA
jgi:pimeloyl-ACP methyl ester carboxylesterase